MAQDMFGRILDVFHKSVSYIANQNFTKVECLSVAEIWMDEMNTGFG